MDVSYRRDKDHNYMVLEAPGNLTGEEYQVRMIVGNKIPHLLKCNRRMMDGKAVFFYEITGMQPMFRVFEKKRMNEENIRDLLLDIKKAVENTERYLLNSNELLFESENLFFDTQTKEWNLCYLPSYEGTITDGFRSLVEYILKQLDHSDEQAVLLGYEIYRKASEENYSLAEVLQTVYQMNQKTYVNSEPEDILEESEELYEENDKENEKEEVKEFHQENQEVKEREEAGREVCSWQEKQESYDLYKEPKRKKQKIKKQKIKKQKTRIKKPKRKKYELALVYGLLVFVLLFFLVWQEIFSLIQAGALLFLAFGILLYFFTISPEELKHIFNKKKTKAETFPQESGTCILQEGENQMMAILVSLRPDEYVNILLYRQETRIGKEERHADVCIDFDVVSRVHAKILRQEEEYFLLDLDSTNGTYVNGRKLLQGSEVRLQQGDRVAFANIEYIFQKAVNKV